METWEFIQAQIGQNNRVMLLVVIDSEGSSPGQPGFKMAVAENGRIMGSIGGGSTEYSLVEKARKLLLEDAVGTRLVHHVHREDAEKDRSGLICSGEHWVAFYPMRQTELGLVTQIGEALRNGSKGMISYTASGITFQAGETEHHKHAEPVTSMEEWEFTEPTGRKNEIYIFGAGHVGLALSQVMRQLGFVVHIFDDREGISTLRENQSAHFSRIVDYREVSHLVPEGENVYAVIMTFGHRSDEIVLQQLLGRKIRYLGMMGSSKKVKKIFENRLAEGTPPDSLEKVDAPIGIRIGSQTPPEIAISIAARIIQVKNSDGR